MFEAGDWEPQAWLLFPVLPLTHCVALGQFLYLCLFLTCLMGKGESVEEWFSLSGVLLSGYGCVGFLKFYLPYGFFHSITSPS